MKSKSIGCAAISGIMFSAMDVGTILNVLEQKKKPPKHGTGGLTMPNLIDRDALMKDVCSHCSGYDCRPDATDTVYGCMFADHIEAAPAVNRWIPCSERLPEENKIVLVSTTTGYVDSAVLRWGKWFPDGYNGVAFPPNRITAWMPKPDAYVPPEKE